MASKLDVLISSYNEAIRTWLTDCWTPGLSLLYKKLCNEMEPIQRAMNERFLPVWQKWVFAQIAHAPAGDWKKSYPGVDVVFLQKRDVYVVSFSNEGNDPYVSFEIENYAAQGITRFHFFEMKCTVQQAFFLINTFCDFAEMDEEHI